MSEPRIKRPSLQWYPGDFRRDLGVQSCSFEVRALWREMLDLMHDGEPYGHLTAGGIAIKTADLARLVGKSSAVVAKWLKELEDRKVFSRTAVGVIYSRRMVRDEAIRNKRAAGGSKSLENERVPKPKDIGEDSVKDPAKDPSCRSLRGSSAGSPAVATAIDAFAVAPAEQVSVGDYALLCTVRANQGLAEHPTRPQPIARIIATNGSSQEAAEEMIAAGVPLEFAQAEVYRLAKSHKAEGQLSSLNYFPKGVVRAWQRHGATNEANATNRPAQQHTDPTLAALDRMIAEARAEEAKKRAS
jgi:hypothetical protein